jgi:hypothetical protein
MLGVWFGPLRPQPAAKEYVKAWGSPQLTPGPTEQAKGQHHELMKGTPEFMRNRQILDTAHQGLNHMWFVGGYVLDYDSQESCLKSALRVATQLIEAHVRKLSSEGKTTLREYSSIEDPASCGVPPILAELAHAAASVDPESSYNLSLREQLHQLL